MKESDAQSVTASSIVTRSRSITSAAIGRETAMLNIEKGQYLGLDEIGTCIWEILERPQSVEQVCSLLQERYDVNAETCRQHVITFIEELLEAGVVHVSPA